MSEADHTQVPTDLSTRPDGQRDRDERDRQLDDVLGAIGQQARERNLSRATTVAGVLEQLPEGGSERLDDAIQAAHKLAGSAGTFGMDQASRIARELERFLIRSRDEGTSEGLHQARADVGELQRLLAP